MRRRVTQFALPPFGYAGKNVLCCERIPLACRVQFASKATLSEGNLDASGPRKENRGPVNLSAFGQLKTEGAFPGCA